MKKFLMVAFHFPPQVGSSGMLRSLKFCRYLPEFGWKPVVLSVNKRAYEQSDDRRLAEIPNSSEVHRVFALDSKRHLSVKGKSLIWTALPDRCVSWLLGAVPLGLSLLRSRDLELIYTTFPIPTALLIGYYLHRITGKPWVADLRDSITEDDYPREKRVWQAYRRVEQKVVRYASRIVFTAESTRRMYLERYPELDPLKCVVVLNGYDEEDFRDLPTTAPSLSGRPLRLVHGGVLYPQERDPRPFFAALSRARRSGTLSASDAVIELRAPGSEAYYHQLITEHGLEQMVRILPLLPYKESLNDAAQADGLLVFQGPTCNHQIPAKVYEYMRLGKPIFALTDHRGDTAALLRDNGGATFADITDANNIQDSFLEYLRGLRQQRQIGPDPVKVRRYERSSQAKLMADLFEELTNPEVQRFDRSKQIIDTGSTVELSR